MLRPLLRLCRFIATTSQSGLRLRPSGYRAVGVSSTLNALYAIVQLHTRLGMWLCGLDP